MTRRTDDRTGPDGIEAIGALAEPVRRRLYEYVAASPSPVGRDEASRGVGVGRPLAAFHLDRLVDDGLLVAEYRRLTGRSGPGAGRPAKVYRRAPGEISVSLPARRYEIAAAVFADALERLEPSGPPDEVLTAARARGRELGAVGAAGELGAAAPGSDRMLNVLDRLGFEPTREADLIRLRNCPFDALARDHRDLTCPANLAFLEGVADGLHAEARPVLRPEPGHCCVVIEGRAEDE